MHFAKKVSEKMLNGNIAKNSLKYLDIAHYGTESKVRQQKIRLTQHPVKTLGQYHDYKNIKTELENGLNSLSRMKQGFDIVNQKKSDKKISLKASVWNALDWDRGPYKASHVALFCAMEFLEIVNEIRALDLFEDGEIDYGDLQECDGILWHLECELKKIILNTEKFGEKGSDEFVVEQSLNVPLSLKKLENILKKYDNKISDIVSSYAAPQMRVSGASMKSSEASKIYKNRMINSSRFYENPDIIIADFEGKTQVDLLNELTAESGIEKYSPVILIESPEYAEKFLNGDFDNIITPDTTIMVAGSDLSKRAGQSYAIILRAKIIERCAMRGIVKFQDGKGMSPFRGGIGTPVHLESMRIVPTYFDSSCTYQGNIPTLESAIKIGDYYAQALNSRTNELLSNVMWIKEFNEKLRPVYQAWMSNFSSLNDMIYRTNQDGEMLLNLTGFVCIGTPGGGRYNDFDFEINDGKMVLNSKNTKQAMLEETRAINFQASFSQQNIGISSIFFELGFYYQDLLLQGKTPEEAEQSMIELLNWVQKSADMGNPLSSNFLKLLQCGLHESNPEIGRKQGITNQCFLSATKAYKICDTTIRKLMEAENGYCNRLKINDMSELSERIDVFNAALQSSLMQKSQKDDLKSKIFESTNSLNHKIHRGQSLGVGAHKD